MFYLTHLLLASGCTLAADSHLGLQLLELLGIHALTSLSCVEKRETTGGGRVTWREITQSISRTSKACRVRGYRRRSTCSPCSSWGSRKWKRTLPRSTYYVGIDFRRRALPAARNSHSAQNTASVDDRKPHSVRNHSGMTFKKSRNANDARIGEEF